MLYEKLIHNLLAITFPLVLNQREPNLHCYTGYIVTMSLLGIIYLNINLCRNQTTKFWGMYKRGSTLVLILFFLASVAITFFDFEDYKTQCVFAIGTILLCFYRILVRAKIKETGLHDFLFTIVITQMLLSLSEETMALFSPINLLCFIVQVTFHAYLNETPIKKEKMNQSEQKFVSAYKILGKEDSFRLMVLIFLYLWTFLMIVSYQQQNIMHILPMALVTTSSFTAIKNFKNQHYDIAYKESRKAYLIFSFAYMLVNILENNYNQ